MERNIALKLMYVGTAYHGWQVQKNAVTVAETLERALSTVVCHPVKCTGAGRTDAGVHAQVYVANFRTTSTIPCDRLPLAVNTRLPDDIVVVRAVQVPMEFNAIGSCRKKEYTYRIYNSRLGNAFYVDRAWFYPKHLDESVMQRAASQFVGTHDFRAVRSVGTETRTTVRTVHYFQVERKGELIECRVGADGFLYNMVRAITGTNDEVIISNAVLYLKISAPVIPPMAVLVIVRNMLQGIQHTIEPLLASGLELIGKVIFGVWIVPAVGYTAVCFCEPVTWVICFVFILGALYRCRGELKDKK